MNIVGLDTCLGACSVAVATGLGTPAARVTGHSERMAKGHAERLLPMLEEALAAAGTTLEAMDRVAVTIGPGTFTGTRIGIAAARALRLTLGLPVVTFSSLEVLARNAALGERPVGRDLAVAIDASRDEAYVELFDGRTPAPLAGPRLIPIATALEHLGARPLFVVGSAADAIATRLQQGGVDALAGARDIEPDIADVIAEAALRDPDTSAVTPLYLRPPDAKPQDGKSLARAGT